MNNPFSFCLSQEGYSHPSLCNVAIRDHIMEKLNWVEEKERVRKAALEKHARLHRLFVEERLTFELERKKTVDQLINSVEDNELRNRMRTWQDSWDTKMRNAGSSHNRFVLARTFFWEHFHEVWLPTIQEGNALLNGPSKDKVN